jgi:hypothetical protein
VIALFSFDCLAGRSENHAMTAQYRDYDTCPSAEIRTALLCSDTEKARDPVLMTSPEPPKAKAIAPIGDNGRCERDGADRPARR